MARTHSPPSPLGEFLRPFFQTLYEVLASNLNYTESLKVRLAALDATCTVVQVLYQPNERAALQELIPVMLSVRSPLSCRAHTRTHKPKHISDTVTVCFGSHRRVIPPATHSPVRHTVS